MLSQTFCSRIDRELDHFG